MLDRDTILLRRAAPPLDRAWALAWQRAARLSHGCARAARRMPVTEQVSLAARLRAAARVVPARVATGQGCARAAERAYHLAIARGALGEVEGMLSIVLRLGYLPADESERLLARCAEARRLLGRLVAATWLSA